MRYIIMFFYYIRMFRIGLCDNNVFECFNKLCMKKVCDYIVFYVGIKSEFCDLVS